MLITEQQLNALDSFEWFSGDVDEIWGEEAYDALTSFQSHRSFDIDQWCQYVHYMFLTQPHLAPTETFCRRIALWYYKERKFTVQEAVEADVDDLLQAYLLGALARVDTIDFSDKQVSRIVNWLSEGRKRSGVDRDALCHFDNWFNHPQATSEHIAGITTQALQRGDIEAEFVLAATASPLTPDTVFEGLSRTAAKAARKATRMTGQFAYRWRFTYSYLSAVYNLPENETRILPRIRKTFKKLHKGRFDLTGYYEDESQLRPSRLWDADNKALDFDWWDVLTPLTFSNKKENLQPTAAKFGVGVDGIPPGVTLHLASTILGGQDSVEAKAVRERLIARNFWVMPYLAGAKKFIIDQSGLDAENVPFEWVAEILNVGAPEKFNDWNGVSDTWKEAQNARQNG